jgi:hypothetical protein
MTQYIIKLIVSATIIVAVSEVSKRSTFLGGLLASLPLVSIMALIWLYTETGDLAKVSSLSTSILWLVIPSLVLFITLPLLLKMKWNFYLSLVAATGAMLICYAGMVGLLSKLGVKL